MGEERPVKESLPEGKGNLYSRATCLYECSNGRHWIRTGGELRVPILDQDQHINDITLPFRIYVYDLPGTYTSLMLEQRLNRGACVPRLFNEHNFTEWGHEVYSLEVELV